MARRPRTTPEPTPIRLTPDEKRQAISRIRRRISELKEFQVEEMQVGQPPQLAALETSISRTLEAAFGERTSDFRRYQGAANLVHQVVVMTSDWSGRSSGPSIHEYREETRSNIESAVALLESAASSLAEDIEEDTLAGGANRDASAVEQISSTDVFIVHGHDNVARVTVARFLEKLGLRPIVLHEQANGGRTLIEKLEHHASVKFAVVLLTPDDTGAAVGQNAMPRARQNVILELGYFIGKLGRKNVCALKRGEIELPSDFVGVVYEDFDESGGWQLKLAKELREAGFAIDLNKLTN